MQLSPPGSACSIALLKRQEMAPGSMHGLHLCVPDIEAARDDMVAKGATVLNGGVPRVGAHGVPVIFVHPKNMGGVLVELMETPKGAH